MWRVVVKRILLVLDHPYSIDSAENVPHRRSFSAAVARAAIRGAESAGHDVDLADLAADGFKPVMSRDELVAWRLQKTIDPQVLDYQRRLLEATIWPSSSLSGGRRCPPLPKASSIACW